MAERTEKLTQNVAGPYYVDASCIDCDLCRETAPASFRRDDDIGMSMVYHQPVTAEEAAAAEEAKIGCPSESIGNDGLVESPPIAAKV
jgi:ferredoxin